MTGELGLEGKEDESNKDQAKSGIADRQDVQREDREDNKEEADNAGNDSAGMIEFDIKCEQSDGEQHEGHVRIHEEAQNLLFERHVEGLQEACRRYAAQLCCRRNG